MSARVLLLALLLSPLVGERLENGMSEKEKRGVEYEGLVPLETVLTYLEDLRGRLASGQVQVQNGSSGVLLIPGESVRLKVRAREKDGEQSLRFEMAWERAEVAPVVNGLSFTAPDGENGKARRSKKAP
jgi:amphi-Trp domain-containing protein